MESALKCPGSELHSWGDLDSGSGGEITLCRRKAVLVSKEVFQHYLPSQKLLERKQQSESVLFTMERKRVRVLHAQERA